MPRATPVVIGLVAAGVVGLTVLFGFTLTRNRPAESEVWALEHMPSRRAYNPSTRWTITEHLTAHQVLIAQVETKFIDEAMTIARQIAEPRKDHYTEVLVYFHRPGRPDTLPPRRVQWTASNGYVENVYLTNEELTKN